MPLHQWHPTLGEKLAPGALFEGHWRVLRELGEGTCAVVVQALDERTQQVVALKVLRPDVVEAHPDVPQRFIKEVQIVRGLQSPNTITVSDFGLGEEGLYYMALEYLEGETLERALRQDGALEPAKAATMVLQILRSLHEAHQQGIVHRDIKPSNIMLCQAPDGRRFVKVLDFGIAKLVEGDASPFEISDSSGGQSTRFIGSPIYMSPEQILGRGVSAATDIYSAGLVLYEALTGESPIPASSVVEVARAHLDESPLPMRSLATIEPAMQRVILQATARYPEQRYGTAEDFARALREALAAPSQGPLAPGPAMPTPGPAPQGLAPQTGTMPTAPAVREYGMPSQEVFSGRVYNALLGDQESSFSAISGDFSGSAPAVVAPVMRPTHARVGSAPKSALELDPEALRAIRQRGSEPLHGAGPARAASRSRAQQAAGIAEALVSVPAMLFLAVSMFVFAAAVLHQYTHVIRVIAGLAPTLLAVVWTVSLQTAATTPGVMPRLVRPCRNRLGAFWAVGITAAALLDPARSTAALTAQASWFLPQGSMWHEVFAPSVQILARGHVMVVEMLAALLPL